MRSLNGKIFLAVVVELIYLILTRTWLDAYAEGIELELYITAVRLLTAVIYWFLFREIILSRTFIPSALARPLLWISVAVVCLAPVLVGDWGLSGQKTQVIFAMTSLAVGIREEILYRGVLQNLLEKRYGWIVALLLSNVIFTLYHYGAWPFTASVVIELFFVGCCAGLLY